MCTWVSCAWRTEAAARASRGSRGPGSRPLALVALILMSFPVHGQPVAAPRGYHLEGNHLVVARAEEWAQWEAHEWTRVIGDSSGAQARRLRRGIDAASNADRFFRVSDEDTIWGGISAVGLSTSRDTALFVIDGDPATYWEPDRDTAPELQWVEIDLGRSVLAERVIVRFVPEGLGDPFLKFRVLASDGVKDFGKYNRRRFFRVGQVSVPNKDQRSFSFEVPPQHARPEGMRGEPVQFVRVQLLDTDGPRGREVSATEYRDLPVADQGAVDYYRRTSGGREIAVVAQSWLELPRERRGPVRYHRREHPRLAEVEVHSLGDNIVAMRGPLRRRRSRLEEEEAGALLTDGLHSSQHRVLPYDDLRNRYMVTVDLGSRFWLDRVRLLSQDTPLRAYQIRLSDGTVDPNGQYEWHSLGRQTNSAGYLQVEETFPLRPVRLLELRRFQAAGEDRYGVRLSEIQAYGEGYADEVVLTSPVFELGGRQLLSRLRWEADAPHGSRVEVRTQTGDELLRTARYFNASGIPVRLEEEVYEKMIREGKSYYQRVIEETLGPDWSPWSEVYADSARAFKSPNPRRMARVQVRLCSSDPLRGAAVRRLELDLEPPLMEELVAEVWPVRGVELGTPQDFTLYLRPGGRPGDIGFDELHLTSSSSVPLELLGLRRGDDLEFGRGQPEILWPGAGASPQLTADGLRIALAQPVTGADQVFELTLRTRVYLPSTSLHLEVSHVQRPGVTQVVDAGDASSQVNSSSLAVQADLAQGSLVGVLSILPPVLSPNGDGINDHALIRFPVYQLRGTHRLQVTVHDLSGRRVRDLSMVTERPSGEHEVPWDGRDDGGALVLPGIYVVRVRVATDADGGEASAARPVHVVY